MNLKESINQIKQIISTDLPGEPAHFPLSPLNRPVSSEAMKNAENVKQSAVSIILLNENDDTRIVLIQRPTYDGKHSGQISFPGGKKEEHDASLFQTAIRECFEEIGFPLGEAIYLGKLTPVYIPISNFFVEPHVFFVSGDFYFEKDDFEVEEVFSVALSEILNPNKLQTEKIHLSETFKKEVPCFKINDRIIWGATALMLNELKEIALKLS